MKSVKSRTLWATRDACESKYYRSTTSSCAKCIDGTHNDVSSE